MTTDTTSPEPKISEWDEKPEPTTSPTEIYMSAKKTMDAWTGEVEYYFACETPGYGCSDSGWQTSRKYTDTGLTPFTQYGYKVRARDKSSYTPPGDTVPGNKTTWSKVEYTTAGEDKIPPTPDPSQWDNLPVATSSTSVSMSAAVTTDPSGPVQYSFECVAGPCNNSGWQTSRTWSDTGLVPDTTYTYRVRAKDQYNNTTGYSPEASATTPTGGGGGGEPGDDMPPLPNPSQWAVGGLPFEYHLPDGYYHTMTAETASDSSTGGNDPVWYYFKCEQDSGNDSGWQLEPIYTYRIGFISVGYRYKVRTCDSIPGSSPAQPNTANAGSWSTIESTIPH
jgi:hypothetical protein